MGKKVVTHPDWLTRTIQQRFDEKWMPEPNSGCWLWTSTLTSKGYGSFHLNKYNRQAHRVAWQLYRGEIHSGLDVLHDCDVKCCVNPNHLHLGTAHDNAVEAVARGFWPDQKGESNGNVKLTALLVQEIRNSTGNYRYLADQYGISKTQIGNIKQRIQWNHL